VFSSILDSRRQEQKKKKEKKGEQNKNPNDKGHTTITRRGDALASCSTNKTHGAKKKRTLNTPIIFLPRFNASSKNKALHNNKKKKFFLKHKFYSGGPQLKDRTSDEFDKPTEHRVFFLFF
jgi:hypothetical protein